MRSAVARRRLGIEPQAVAPACSARRASIGVGAAPGLAQVGQRLRVDRKEAGRGAVLGRHVGDHRAVAGASGVPTPGPKNSTKSPVTSSARRRCVTTSARSVASTPGRELADQAHADHVGDLQHGRHAEHHRLRLEAADTPAEHADAVDHRRVAVGADHHVGHRPLAPSRCSVVTTVASCSRLMVCMIPVPGGWMRTPGSALEAQRRKR